MSDNTLFFTELGLRRVINAAGRMTALGASTQSTFVQQAMMQAASHYIDVEELLDAADRLIAQVTGAEAGFITSCSAAGIAITTAACISRGSRARTEQLPFPKGPPDEVILQKGHAIHFGAEIVQMLRLAGARVVEVGTVNRTLPHHLESAITEHTAAVMVAVSHHTQPGGALSLAQTIEIAHRARVPVIVDAAAELDLCKYIAAGADLVIYSGHKGFSAPTSGIVAGSAPLIEACRMQNLGIGRTMKIGKENIIGCLAALTEHMQGGVPSRPAEIDSLELALQDVDGLKTSRHTDPTRPEIVRLRLTVNPVAAGLDAQTLVRRLAEGSPSVRVREHGVSEDYVEIDFRTLTSGEVDEIAAAVHRVMLGEKD